MELDFSHGFIPRIGEENYKAVDRCVGPADLFSGVELDLPWALVDGAWSHRKPDLLYTLRGCGTKLLIDTFGWHYRFGATGDIEKLRTTSWAPDGPVTPADHKALTRLVQASLRAQADLKADAYLVPGLLPEETPYFVSGVYLQLTPISPAKDTPSKLENITGTYLHASGREFKVIAGHAGAAGPALHAFGIDAADAGLANGETFDQTRARRTTKRKSNVEDNRSGGRKSRMYFEQIGRSLEATDVVRTLAVAGAAAELRGCRLPCHRFRSDHILEQAHEHSLWARVIDAQRVHSLPPSMRANAVYERLRTQRSTLTTINGALEAAGEPALSTKPIENHLTWISRLMAARSAA